MLSLTYLSIVVLLLHKSSADIRAVDAAPFRRSKMVLRVKVMTLLCDVVSLVFFLKQQNLKILFALRWSVLAKSV